MATEALGLVRWLRIVCPRCSADVFAPFVLLGPSRVESRLVLAMIVGTVAQELQRFALFLETGADKILR